MKRSYAVGWIAGLALGLVAAPLTAQTTVQRAVDVLNRPQTGPVVVEPGRTTTTTRTTTTVIVPQREVVVVERVHGRRYGWWKNSQYRVITVYYDGSRFYRRPFDRRVLRKVVVYQRAGRYYIDEDQWRQTHDRQWGHDDKWKDDDDRGHDDKWKNDDGGKNDDKWKDDDDKDESKGNNGRHLGQDPDHHKDNWR
jgi:hypothetical protein